MSGTGAIGQQHSHHAAGRRIRGAGNLRGVVIGVVGRIYSDVHRLGSGVVVTAAGSGRGRCQRQQSQQPQGIGRPQCADDFSAQSLTGLHFFCQHGYCIFRHSAFRHIGINIAVFMLADQQAAFGCAGGIGIIAFKNQIGIVDGGSFKRHHQIIAHAFGHDVFRAKLGEIVNQLIIYVCLRRNMQRLA